MSALQTLATRLANKYGVHPKVHRDKRNGYIDLKSGEWGAVIYGKEAPVPGDKAFLTIPNNEPPQPPWTEEVVKEVLSDLFWSHPRHWVVSLVSQDQAEALFGKVQL
jgi:hypothetical protein